MKLTEFFNAGEEATVELRTSQEDVFGPSFPQEDLINPVERVTSEVQL